MLDTDHMSQDHILISTDGPECATTPRSGILSGFTTAIKDMLDVEGFVTTRGAAVFDPTAASVSAESVAALQDEGAVVIGKANQDEFAWGVMGANPHWGRITNPLYPELTAGGSSGGTAAAIASGIARIGLGTDTAGSVRIPAACCGIVGLRPRVGAISSRGVFPLAPSFDTVGPMAANVADCALVWHALTGETPDQITDLHGMKMGVLANCAQASRFRDLGASVSEVVVPAGILDAFWTIMHAEAFRTHKSVFTKSPEKYGVSVREKLASAAIVTSEDEASARIVLRQLRQEFRSATEHLDAIIAPTLGRPAPKISVRESTVRDELGWIVATISALDLPALSIGNLQITAPRETTALAIGRLWEDTIGEVPPPW